MSKPSQYILLNQQDGLAPSQRISLLIIFRPFLSHFISCSTLMSQVSLTYIRQHFTQQYLTLQFQRENPSSVIYIKVLMVLFCSHLHTLTSSITRFWFQQNSGLVIKIFSSHLQQLTFTIHKMNLKQLLKIKYYYYPVNLDCNAFTVITKLTANSCY